MEVQECYVLLERLPAEHCGYNKYVREEAARADPGGVVLPECSVRLERLPADLVAAKTPTTEHKQVRAVPATPAPCLPREGQGRAPAATRRKRLGTRNGGVQVARSRGLRQSTVSQGAASRQAQLYKEVALLVTQRSAQRRGRARLPRPPTAPAPSAPSGANGDAAPGPPPPAQVAAVAVAPEAPPRPAPPAGATPLDAGLEVAAAALSGVEETPAPPEGAAGGGCAAPAALDMEGEGESTTAEAEDEEGPAPVPSLLRVQCFTDMIKEMVEEGGELSDVFAGCEKVILRHWLDLSQDAAAVYLDIVCQPGPFFRASGVKGYPDALDLFRALERTGFVCFTVSHCEVADLAELLRKEELEAVVEAVGLLPRTRTKLALVRTLVRHHGEGERQAALVHDKLQAALGGCVRVRSKPRSLVQRALLLQSAWLGAPADGDRLGAARRHLLRPVARLLTLADGAPPPHRAMFSSQQQADEWEMLARQRHELHLMASGQAPSAKLVAIAEELLQRYQVHVAIGSLQTGGVGCRTMGDLLAETLSVASEMLRRTALMPALVEEILLVLLEQRLHAQKRRPGWVVALAALLQAAGNLDEAAKVLLHELDNEGHGGAHRALLIEALRPLAKTQLEAGLLQRVRGLVGALPSPRFCTVSVPATALKGSAPSLKRVYVFRPRGEATMFLSVEERVMAHFAEAYPQGRDDEGATLEALAVLAMWPAVYDGAVRDAWGSPCQDRPLDWGLPGFWAARYDVFEHLLSLMAASADALAADLCAQRRARKGTPSLVCWELLEELDIARLLKCITVPVFAAICRRIFCDFTSNRPGFPDLLLWNPQECKSLFVEVKGPRDSLRQPQVEWLSYLRDNGADVAVASVTER